MKFLHSTKSSVAIFETWTPSEIYKYCWWQKWLNHNPETQTNNATCPCSARSSLHHWTTEVSLYHRSIHQISLCSCINPTWQLRGSSHEIFSLSLSLCLVRIWKYGLMAVAMSCSILLFLPTERLWVCKWRLRRLWHGYAVLSNIDLPLTSKTHNTVYLKQFQYEPSVMCSESWRQDPSRMKKAT